jgi:hypothetical protein
MPVELRYARDTCHRLIDGAAKCTGDPIRQNFRHRSTGESKDRCSAGHGFDHDKPKGFRPADREREGNGVAEKSLFFLLRDFTDELNSGLGQKRPDYGLKVLLVLVVHLCGNLQGQPGAQCDFDRPFRTFLGGYAAEEGKVFPRAFMEGIQIFGKTVMYGSSPIQPGDRAPLRVRDRHDGDFAELMKQRYQVRNIQTSV